MLHLKNRNESIPGGFQWIQAETGYEAPANLSFRKVVDGVVGHRVGNSWLAKKHSWNTDWNSVADEVEHANALRMQSNLKWHHFLGADDGGASFSSPFQFPSGSVRAGVAAVKRVAAGVGVLLNWLGSGGRAAPKELAEKRAEICSSCPQNKDGDWAATFTAPVAEMLKLQLGIKNDLKLSTSKDAQLHTCAACSCILSLKVFTPLQHILDNTDEATKQRLDPRCWITKENA